LCNLSKQEAWAYWTYEAMKRGKTILT